MKRRVTQRAKVSTKAWSALIIGFCTLILAGRSYGQENINIDLGEIIQETQKMSQSPNEITLVWWLPEQFWWASLQQEPTLTKAQIDQFLEIIRPYTVIAVVDGRVGTFGGITYTSEEAIRTSVIIKNAKGLSYDPLRESAVDPDMKNLLQIMKSIIVNNVGPFGKNTHFLLFPGKSQDGRYLADPTSEGIFYVLVAGKEFNYRLPLGSVLSPKYDAETGERFPGNYQYNPFTGRKLVIR